MALPDYNPETILIEAADLPPAQAIKFFRQQGFKITWDWKETLREANLRTFTVAKAMSQDILQEIRNELEKALTEGQTFKQFRENLEPFLRKRGWWGMQVIDGQKVQTGSVHRLKNIYRTNTQTAYNAGRWETQERGKKRRPILRLNEVLDGATRDSHRAVSGTMAPVGSPFWNRWYPPNGFGCRGRVQSLTEKQAKSFGYRQTEPLPKTRPDTGFSSNPGKAFEIPDKKIDADLKREARKMKPLYLEDE